MSEEKSSHVAPKWNQVAGEVKFAARGVAVAAAMRNMHTPGGGGETKKACASVLGRTISSLELTGEIDGYLATIAQ